MRYYIISGEASGDLHGSNLIKQLRAKDAHAVIRAWGGDLMEAAGADVVKHYRDLAFMGFAEVIANLRTILRNFKNCKDDVLRFEPDVLILIDYPGFNLRMAEFAHKKGLKVFYYISPQIWAWKQNRVKKIKAFVDEMYVILPFEKDFYAKFDVDVRFVGHPLIDAVAQFSEELGKAQTGISNEISTEKPLVVLMPGSRKQEISKMLPLMLKLAEKLSEFQFVVAGAPGQDRQFYSEYLNDSSVDLVFGQTYDLLSKAHAALVTSGTATLEAAIFKVPQVVCYRGGSVSYMIAKNLVKINYISLVNLIMNREVVKELIQNELNFANLEKEFLNVAQEGKARERLLGLYEELYNKLGGTGASELTADLMLKSLKA